MRGLLNSATNFISTTAQDVRAVVHAHFGSHFGGSFSGVFVRIPFTRLSAFIEHSRVPVGFGLERNEGGLELFVGRARAVVCVEPKAAW